MTYTDFRICHGARSTKPTSVSHLLSVL